MVLVTSENGMKWNDNGTSDNFIRVSYWALAYVLEISFLAAKKVKYLWFI